MILPTKHLPLERTLLAAGAQILEQLTAPMTVSTLWEEVRGGASFPSFDRLVLALDMLCALGMVVLHDGKLRREQLS